MSDPPSWTAFLLAVALVVGGYMGYLYGHREGERDSEAAAMGLFFDRCFVPEAPAFCMEMLAALQGDWDSQEPVAEQELAK